MIEQLEIPEVIYERVKKYFSPQFCLVGEKFLRQGSIAISFKKEISESYFVVSGIVRDSRSFETKVSYKQRLEDDPRGPFASNCDCHLWSAQKHCPHSAGLLLAYLLEKHLKQNPDSGDRLIKLQNSISEIPVTIAGNGMGVVPEEYGTIIKSPQKLVGASGHSTYSSLYYSLANKKIVPFPLPQDFKGKLILSIQSHWDQILNQAHLPTLSGIAFSYQDEEGKIFDKVSLFESLYLFNWETAEVFHLPKNLREMIQKFRNQYYQLSTNDIITLYQEVVGNKLNDGHDAFSLHIDSVPFEQIPQLSTSARITLLPNASKGNITFTLAFTDSELHLAPIPEFLGQFAFKGGRLSSFKRKRDAYDFITSLKDSFEFKNDQYRKSINTYSDKNKWIELIEVTREAPYSYYYRPEGKFLFTYDNHLLVKLFGLFESAFGEYFFRFSTWDQELHELRYTLSPNILFKGLNELQRQLSPFGVEIFYDRRQINNWTARVRFERRSSATKWFDLRLNINQEDLEVLKNADLETGMALTNKGLVLIDKAQRDLLRFVKRYAQIEGKEETPEQNPVNPELVPEEAEKSFLLPLKRTRMFELFELRKMGLDGALTQEEIELCERLANFESIPEYPMDQNLEQVLRPYQKIGHHWLNFLFENKLGACLADDMGLGKTLQTIAFLQSVKPKISKVLIVCPVTILINWEKEIQKFSHLVAHIYHGGSRHIDDQFSIILTSYGVMKKEYNTTFKNIHFDVLILDEVQHLKNMRSLGSLAAREIDADFRICLTGTPVENDLAEFYNILDLCVPGLWGDLQMIRTISNTESRVVARKTAAPFILRRTKSQVLTELPPKSENTVLLPFTDEEHDTYHKTLENIRQRILMAPSQKKYGEILKGLLELRQRCLWQNHPPAHDNYKGIVSTKIDFLLEQLEQILEEGHQVIIFSQFTTYLDIIEKILQPKIWKSVRIDGSQGIKKRQEQVDLFQAGKAQIFLISLKAGGVGLNLTAASYVFIMDPWWNPAVESQAIDRAHRIGQKNTLTVYRPVIKGSVEEKVLELQEQKKQLFNDLLAQDDDQYFSGKLSMKDFEHLFSDSTDAITENSKDYE